MLVSVSPLFSEGSILPNFFLKDALHITSPLVSAFTKLSQSSATLRCLTSLPTKRPTVVGRWFYILVGFDGVGLMLTKLSV